MFRGLYSVSDSTDATLAFILGVDILLLLFITGVMLVFIFKYSRKRNRIPAQIEGNVKLEIIWMVIPTILVMVMFFYGAKGYLMGRDIPEDAMLIKTTARKWSWAFEYPNEKFSDTLVVPEKTNIRLDLVSTDVIHSFYAPDFRLKMDAMPGRVNSIWFRSNYTGDFNIFCAEYCGTAHSGMRTRLKVLDAAAFNTWLNTKDTRPRGEVLYKSVCKACHSLDGSILIGPSFRGLYGSKVTVVANGEESSFTADDDYIRRSIQEPSAQLRKGYKDLMIIEPMPDSDIDSLVIFLKSL